MNKTQMVRTLNEKLLKENLDEGVTSDKSRPCKGPATSITSCNPDRDTQTIRDSPVTTQEYLARCKSAQKQVIVFTITQDKTTGI